MYLIVNAIFKHKIDSFKPEKKSVSKFLLNSLLGRLSLLVTCWSIMLIYIQYCSYYNNYIIITIIII